MRHSVRYCYNQVRVRAIQSRWQLFICHLYSLKIKYFPLRAFLSHTRFHYRHHLLFILHNGILFDNSPQRYGT